MVKASVSELKNQLSAYLKRVRSGETVVIYDRDQPIARLERIEGVVSTEDHLARLERAGVIRRGRKRVPMKLLRGPAPRSKRSVVDALLEERRDGR